MNLYKNLLVLFFITSTILYAQTPAIESKSENIGVWENDSKIISINSDENGLLKADVVLKTFYGFYYDGVYPIHESVPVNLARIDNALYTEYWTKEQAYKTLGKPIVEEQENDPVFKVKVEKPIQFDSASAIPSDGVLWLPKSNTTELSIDETMIKDEVLGYYVDENSTYEIRYWITDIPYKEEKVALKLIQSSDSESVFINKYIQIGNAVYTCATGLRTEIRNVKSVETIHENITYNETNSFLVMGEPYIVLSDISNVDEEILAHNSIPRPPRNGLAKFVEPSIYKKLESMTIEDFEDTFSPNY